MSCLKAKGINTTHLMSVSTDGTPSLIGAQKGFVNLLQKSLDRELVTFHCILHQEALCAKTFPPECVEVMNLIKLVNKIIANRLNHRQFRHCLFRSPAAQQSPVAVKGRRAETLCCLSGTCENLLGKQRPQLSQTRKPRLAEKVLLHMTSHLNTLNKNLQGKGRTACRCLRMFWRLSAR